ncbi:MAG: long-chain fatty acid--CoA ligase [Deltaproteobacteria bacterium]|nr:long-chain fatty acid--CoA ligase [Deltaproteobacteria bacterium]
MMTKEADMNSVYDNPNNLVDLFEQSVAKWPNNRLFGTKNPASGKYEWVTRREVADRVDNLRGALKKLGLSRGERVGVILNNCSEWFICEQAVHGLGGVFVPMYLQELPKVMHYIITDAEVKFLFVQDGKAYDKVKDFKNNIPTLKEIFVVFGEGGNSLAALEETGRKNPAPSIKPAWSDLANIVYTSGTTGDPKGVMLSHGTLTLCPRAGVDMFDLDETMHVVAILPWAHVFGLAADLHDYILCGGGIAFAESVDKLIQNFAEVKPTGLSVVPRIVNKVYDTIQQGVAADPVKKQFFDAAVAEAIKNRDLPEKTKEFKDYDALVFSQVRNIFGGALKFFVTGSALMKPEIALFFKDIGQPTFDGYGLTETGPTLTMNSPKYGNKYGTVGKVVKNMHVVIDKSRVGVESLDGEIIAYGPHIMMGYLNKPQQTAEVMMPDTWNGFPGLRTGDRGWIDEEGYLHITGRFKDEYKLANGKYVHPEGIENEVKLLRYVLNVMLYGDGKDYNVALVVPDFAALKADPDIKPLLKSTLEESLNQKALTDYLSKDIIAHLRKTYGSYEVPQKFLFIAEDFTVDSGMLTQTMKLKRPLVLKRYGEQLQNLYK